MIQPPVTTNEQIEAEEKRAAQAKAEIEEASAAASLGALTNNLRGHIWSAFEKAREDKRVVQEKMIQNLLQKRGEYDIVKLAQIKELGSELFMMITDVKCRITLAMLHEIYNHPGEKSWTIDPTPIPKLTPEMESVAELTFMAELENFLVKVKDVPPEMLQSIMTQALPKFKKEFKAVQMEVAMEKAANMENKIQDQLIEGGFYKAVNECLADLVDLKAGFLKGPIYRKEKVFELKEDPDRPGRAKRVVREEIRPEWDSPSAFDIFPLAGVTDINKGGLIEILRYQRKDLQEMIGLDGFDEVAIREILENFQSRGLHQWTWDADEIRRAEAEGRETAQYYDWQTIDAIEYHDTIPGKFIMEWSGAPLEDDKTFKYMGKSLDPDFDYPVVVWLIDRWVLKIQLNENPLGLKPYYKASYIEQKGAFWGRGLPETMKDGQTLANSVIRALQNNVGIASGPQVGIDKESLSPGQDDSMMWPWKIWKFIRQAFSSQTQPFMQFFQPQMHTQELIMAYDKASKICDEHSGIAGFTHGDRNIGGAGNTASGFSMFAGMQDRGIKDVASIFDDKVIAPAIEALYYENYDLDDALEYIGDVKIKARGSSWLFSKQTQALRLNDFLRLVGTSPIFQQLMGEQGAVYALQEAAKSLNLEGRKLVPDKEFLKPVPGMGATAPAPGSTPIDQAGNRTQGVDTNAASPAGG